jgi:CRISPR-associated protein Cas5t
MRVLKIVAEGITTSFRYPHFMHGMHPSFEMPPPATIYGHICSALGEWVDPEGINFAYHFTYKKSFEDLEHVHVVEKSSGKFSNLNMPKALEGAVNPFKRTLLFQPKLILYLNRPEWKEAFLSPKYTLVLGRSQDLFTYKSVSVINLKNSLRAYFEATLLPYNMLLPVGQGYSVLMPRFLDYKKNRAPKFFRYAVLKGRVFSNQFFKFSDYPVPDQFWIDPETPLIKDAQMGLMFHSFVDNGNLKD